MSDKYSGSVQEMIDLGLASQTFTYDANGNLLTLTVQDAKGDKWVQTTVWVAGTGTQPWVQQSVSMFVRS